MLGRFATSVEPTGSSVSEKGVRTLAVCNQASDEKGESKHTFLLTAGPDWKVRYWDTSRPDSSMVVSGLGAEEAKPSYTVSQPSLDTVVVQERLQQGQGQEKVGSVGRSGRESSARRNGTQKTGRSSGLISMQQQHLLKSHVDTVLDVALIEQPYGMVISADRSGVINLFM
jgi:phosphoinositide-3-kinase regulatory subunit 4